MGYWATDIDGHSFNSNAKLAVKGEAGSLSPGAKLIWGDAPADELDRYLDEVFDILNDVPEREDLLDLFSFATSGAPKSRAAIHLQSGLSAASAAFHADWDRDPSSAELRAGFLFSINNLDLAQDLRQRSARRIVGEQVTPPAF
jgi:hypothetical protein